MSQIGTVRTAEIAGRRARPGHVLLDVAIGALILSFCAIAFSSTFTTGKRAGSKSRHQELATNACYTELEARRNQGVNAIPNGASATTLTGTSLLRRLTPDLPQAVGTLVVQRMAATGSAPNYSFQPTSTDTGRLQLTMTVSWSGVDGDSGSVSVTTMVRR